MGGLNPHFRFRSEEELIRAVAAAQSDDEPGLFDKREPMVPTEHEWQELRPGAASNENDDPSKYGGIPYGYGCP